MYKCQLKAENKPTIFIEKVSLMLRNWINVIEFKENFVAKSALKKLRFLKSFDKAQWCLIKIGHLFNLWQSESMFESEKTIY